MSLSHLLRPFEEYAVCFLRGTGAGHRHYVGLILRKRLSGAVVTIMASRPLVFEGPRHIGHGLFLENRTPSSQSQYEVGLSWYQFSNSDSLALLLSRAQPRHWVAITGIGTISPRLACKMAARLSSTPYSRAEKLACLPTSTILSRPCLVAAEKLS